MINEADNAGIVIVGREVTKAPKDDEGMRVAVIGVGHLGQHHARILAGVPGVELAAVVDINRARAEGVAAEFGGAAFTEWQDIRATVDAVTVATPTETHAAIVEPLLQQGVHVLVEKPMTRTTAEADRLLAAAAAGGAAFGVGHTERFNPAVAAARAVVGEPRFIEVHRLGTFPDRSLDIDVVFDLMIHDLDLVLQFAGSEVTNIDAVGVPVLTPRIDIANVRLRFASGCIANLTASRISRDRVRKIRFFQRDSYVSIDYTAQEVEHYRLVPRPGAMPEIDGGKLEVVEGRAAQTRARGLRRRGARGAGARRHRRAGPGGAGARGADCRTDDGVMAEDILTLGMRADEARRQTAGSTVWYQRVQVIRAVDLEGSCVVPDAASEVRLHHVPASLEDALNLVRAAKDAAGPKPLAAFSMFDVAERSRAGWGELGTLLTQLAGAGMHALAEFPADLLDDLDEHVRVARTSGIEVSRLTIANPLGDRTAEILSRIRHCQTSTGGIARVAPLPRNIPTDKPTTGYEDVRTVALARLAFNELSRGAPVLIEVDWSLYGPKLAQVALTFGADFLDAVPAVSDDSLGPRRSTVQDVERNIRAAGFEPEEFRPSA